MTCLWVVCIVLTSCAKVQVFALPWHVLFDSLRNRNSYVRKHHMHLKFCKGGLAKYIVCINVWSRVAANTGHELYKQIVEMAFHVKKKLDTSVE